MTDDVRLLTHDQLMTEAHARFETLEAIAFRCPGCGDVATVAEFIALEGTDTGRCGQECIGRSLPAGSGRGCQQTAHGILPGPWQVLLTVNGEQRSMWCFPLADPPPAAPASPETGDHDDQH